MMLDKVQAHPHERRAYEHDLAEIQVLLASYSALRDQLYRAVRRINDPIAKDAVMDAYNMLDEVLHDTSYLGSVILTDEVLPDFEETETAP